MSIEVQELESWLRDRAAEALRIPAAEIDPSRPLIDQGLDSLGAIELGQAVETALGVALPPGVLLEGASIAALVAQGAVGCAVRTAGDSGVRGPGAHSAPYSPLSHAQRGLWFLHRLHPTSTAYHLSTMTRVLGEVSNEGLRSTFQAMADRHPALRTTFPLAGDEPVQIIPEQGEVAFEVIDATGWSDAELRSRMDEAAFRPFDLERGPVFRADLFDRGAERFLVVSMHHIVSDFGALVNLVQEAPREGTKSFAQFVDWQAEMLAGPEGARLEAFWRERLAGLPELDLPADRVKPANAPEQGGAAWREVGAEALVRLKALARSRGATLYVVLLAAFQAYLHRITGQEDFAVGSPVAGRPAGFGRVFGYFTNPVVLRAEMEGDPPFRELVDRARRRVVEALDNQHFPLPLLVERLRARSELFRVLFVLHRAPAEAGGLVSFSLGEGGGRLGLDGFELESLPVAPRGAQFDVTLAAGERRGALGLQIIYDAARFEAATIARWLQHLDNLLTGAAAQPESRLSELPLLSSWERHQVLREVNDGSDADLPWSTLHEGFERQAARTPAAIALIDGTRRLTYRDLDAQASALAEKLRARGAGPESVVAVKLPRTAELIVALLGVLKAGAAYLPLDPAYPEERIAFMLADAGAAVVIENGALSSFGSFTSFKSFHPTPGSLAYLIYTSGSTGRPKGVAIEHAAAIRLVSWARRVFSPAELRGVLAATSVNFDLSIFEIFVPLSCGGAIILAENALALPELPARDEVTLINTVPSAIAGLLEMGPLPASVRTVNLAGEPLRRALADQVLDAGVKLWDLYGPSEDTTYSTGAVVAAGDPFEPLIGWPLAGSQAFVLGRLEQGFRPLPLGVPGELCLGGGGLARGYLGRAALTAEKFVPSPFGEEPGARLYRTGDLVRRRGDGALEYLGRIDHQVKIRGFRIELGEVEAALLAAGVREAVVVAREGSLVAYVVTEQSEEALREALRDRLPAPFVPSFFVFLDALPRTPNGKVDRKALPAPAIAVESIVEAPVGPVEEAVAAVWAGVLGRDRIGRSETFFELGGHSLLAARVMARLREALGVDLPLTALFDAPTVAGLAARVAVAQAASERPLAPVPRNRPLPLSSAQQRLWFLDRLDPGSPLYNIPVALRVSGTLDVARLERALTEIERRHEALRTVFLRRDGLPVQEIRPPAPFALPVVDLSGLSLSTQKQTAAGLISEEARRPFDLEHGPVWRAVCVRESTEEHALLLTVHHIAGDGWSLEVLEREVGVLYGGRPLPALPVQYADFAVWQRERLTGAALQRDLAWWREQLAGVEPLELPGDRKRPAAPTTRGFDVTAPFPAGLAMELEAFARHRNVTLYHALLAGFAALLTRWTGQRDVCVGAPLAGRGRTEVEGLIGLFVNTLVLRLDLSETLDFAALVGRAWETALAAQVHGEMPFERLVEELVPERTLGRAPLVQTVFDLAHAAPPRELAGGARLERLPVETGTAKFDLSLNVIEADGALTAILEASTDLFDRTTGQRLLDTWLRLLAAAVREPDIPLTGLPLLAASERAQVIHEWNDTAAERPRVLHLWDLFERHVRERPGTPALVWGETRLTYGDLAAAVDPLARRLRDLGVGIDVPVAFCLERGIGRIIAILATFKAGGGYVPFDPAWPADRLAWILESCGAPVLITEESFLERFAGYPGTVLLWPLKDTPLQSLEPLMSFDSSLDPQGQGIAYILYTSGSTGRPKGVVIEHRAAAIYVQTFAEELGVLPEDRLLQFASIGFDLSVEEIFAAFAVGATLHLAPADLGLAPAAYLERCRHWELTVLTMPTAFWHEVVYEIAAHPEALPRSLRKVVLGGQAALPERVLDWWRLAPGVELFNSYGPTEATISCTWAALPEGCLGAYGVPIGGPFRHMQIYILDRELRPVPPGWQGELCAGGSCLGRGYLGRPDLTAERFVPDPFAATPGARLYRTGDLTRHRPGGAIDFLGRLDDQVKIRGFRIEPGEIETALTACPAVAAAAVLVPADGRGERRLVAFVVPADPVHPAGAEEIRDFLKSRLPDYMVPAAFAFLDALPLNASGKVDRRLLIQKAAHVTAPAAAGEGEAPRTPVEQVVAAIWSDLLGIENVGRRDVFFDRGGHSLLAARVCARLRDAFGVEVPVRDLFEEPTVAGLSIRVEAALQARGGEAAPPLVPLAPEERAAGVPLSFAQRRLWFFERLEPGTPLYHIPAVLRATGPLDAARLERAFAGVERRQEALRTVIAAPAGDPLQVVQRVLPPRSFVLSVTDLTALPVEEREARARELAAEEGLRPFDLEGGPLWRASLVRLGAEDHLVLLTLHHIVSDGWSMGVLLREVAAHYEEKGEALPALPVQYADWAVWQQQWLSGGTLERGLAAWRQRLAGAPSLLELPTDLPRPAARTFRGFQHTRLLPASLAGELQALARREGATLFMVLLAAFQALLARWSGQRDLVVGTPVAGRDRVDIENLIGFFVNTLPLRGRLAGDPSFRALVAAAREMVLAAHAHREVPFERLVEELAPERDPGHAPLVQVVLSLGNTPHVSPAFGGVTLAPVDVAGEATAKFDLLVAMEETPEGLGMVWEASADLFDPGSVAGWAHRFEVLLADVVRDPDLPVEGLPLLDPIEARSVLGAASDRSAGSAGSSVVPRDPVEEIVASVWAEVLGIPADRIGPRDTFFTLGGHSLLGTSIVSKLRQAFGIEVRLREVLERSTIEALADLVRAALADRAAGPVAPPLVRLQERKDPPLSFAQLRLWIIDRIEPGSATYNVALAVRLEGVLDPGLLGAAFTEVARRHEAVRTTFAARTGDPVQVVHPPAPVPLPVLDLEALPEREREREARRLALKEEMRPFDLERGPVLRTGLLRLGPAEHLLLLTLHHIVCDEWSIRLLFHEVVTLYTAWREGRPAALPVLPVQYADYAAWQREWLAGPVLASQLAFWRTRLGDPPVLELPTDRPRPPLQTFRGARLPFVLPTETSAALFALSRRRGATAFMTLLAAFQALLARTAGQTDLTVGTPISGRTRAEVENLIGFFLNTLVMRADLSGDPGFGVLVDRTRARALEAYAHQDLPFEKLVDELGVRRSLGHSPLFQALFVLLHTTPLAESAGLRATPYTTEGATAKFDLTLAMHAEGESLSGVIEYNTDLFDRTTALRLAERFRVLCAAAVQEPHRPLSDLPVLPEAEMHQVLRENNDRPPRHDVAIRLHDLITAWAARDPERIAVEWPGGSWTYAEFVGRARQLAGRLRALGVGPDVPVGVSAGRGPELALAFLAVLEAGGAYLPIDPAYPRERQEFMLEDSGAKVILDAEFILDHSGEALIQGPEATSENVAYLIYTSGSTGKPKGIAVTHRVLRNLILWQIDPDRRGAMPGSWRTLQFSSPSFDVSLHEMLSTWCTGGTLVLASDDDRRDPERLARFLAEAGIERLFLPYVALQQLADQLAKPETPVPSRLCRVITAGEQLQVTPQVAEAFRQLSAATGGTILYNHYGPSETHVVTELILEGDPARWPAVPSIGRPIAGVSAHVLDRALKPMPIGVPGELALGGFSPARGYLERPDQTAGKFIPDPWSGAPGARLYRSGDLARLLPDGTIEFLGRIDHQVKIRGYRVEPGEIEAVLATHPRVRECAVAVREDRPGERRLIAWVVIDGTGDVALTELRDHLRARLPEPMVPSAFVKLDALPLTPSGKVQRSALPAPEGERLAAAPYVEPSTSLEREIAAIFREELGLDRVGREDNFFDLGGHSLIMVRAAARLTERLGRPVAVLDLFRAPSVASLARQLGGEEETLPARETLEERAETRRQSLSRRRELRRGR